MRCGLIFGARNPRAWRTDWSRLYAETLSLAELGDERGFDSIWVSEHHFSEDGYCSSPLALTAAIAARTKRAAVGTNILVLPLQHPLRVAEDAAVIDLISGGRMVLGVGAGYRDAEFAAFGIPLEQRFERMREGIELIRQAWGGGELRHDAGHYPVSGVHVTPPPARPGGPPIWLGARTEASTRRAGRIADGLILSRGRAQLDWFAEGARKAGRDPSGLPVATIRLAFCAESRAAAIERAGPHILYHENAYADWFRRAGDIAAERRSSGFERVDDLPLERYILGTPDECVAAIQDLLEGFGFTDLIIWGRLPGMAYEEARRSLELIADEVLPRLPGSSAPHAARMTGEPQRRLEER